MSDPDVLGLMQKIDVFPDPEMDKLIPHHRAARAEIFMKDGTKLTSDILDAKGEPENPGSGSDIFDKFRMLAGTVFMKNKVERILEKIDNLEKVKDISELNSLLAQAK
jgi:2-methylcitrate dehydratase PrpD